jgi:hypothetical protein
MDGWMDGWMDGLLLTYFQWDPNDGLVRYSNGQNCTDVKWFRIQAMI